MFIARQKCTTKPEICGDSQLAGRPDGRPAPRTCCMLITSTRKTMKVRNEIDSASLHVGQAKLNLAFKFRTYQSKSHFRRGMLVYKYHIRTHRKLSSVGLRGVSIHFPIQSASRRGRSRAESDRPATFEGHFIRWRQTDRTGPAWLRCSHDSDVREKRSNSCIRIIFDDLDNIVFRRFLLPILFPPSLRSAYAPAISPSVEWRK